MRQVRALVRGHREVEAEDKVRMLGVMRLAYHGSPEAVEEATERWLASAPEEDAGDDGENGLADVAAAFGLKLVERP